MNTLKVRNAFDKNGITTVNVDTDSASNCVKVRKTWGGDKYVEVEAFGERWARNLSQRLDQEIALLQMCIEVAQRKGWAYGFYLTELGCSLCIAETQENLPPYSISPLRGRNRQL